MAPSRLRNAEGAIRTSIFDPTCDPQAPYAMPSDGYEIPSKSPSPTPDSAGPSSGTATVGLGSGAAEESGAATSGIDSRFSVGFTLKGIGRGGVVRPANAEGSGGVIVADSEETYAAPIDQVDPEPQVEPGPRSPALPPRKSASAADVQTESIERKTSQLSLV